MLPALSLSRRGLASGWMSGLLLLPAVLAVFFTGGRAEAQTVRTALAATHDAAAMAGDAGVLPGAQRLELVLSIAPDAERTAALDGYLAGLTDVSSPVYRHWLTPAEFASRFGATADQLAMASAWAAAQGLKVEAVSPGGLRVKVSGTATQVQAAFGTVLHAYQANGTSYYANTIAPTIDAPANLFAAVDGLDSVASPGAQSFAGLAAQVDANATPVLRMDGAMATLSQGSLAEYGALARQAAAQGMALLAPASSGVAGLPEVTAVAVQGDSLASAPSYAQRPGWQAAPGLPADGLRHAPDLAAASVTALTQTLSTLAASAPGLRLGNVNPVLYALAATPGLFTQADNATPGTWEAASGLGLVDLVKLAAVYPRGTGMSYTSFTSSSYSPTHGQSVTLTATVTTGTGGATPTGSVAFTDASGTVLGTGVLTNGTATYTTRTLAGGNYKITAAYAGDATYAASSSNVTQIFVGPEAAALSVAIPGSPTIGSSYTVNVTATAPSGVGAPTGIATVTLSATGTVYSAPLTAGASGSTAAIAIPASTVGTLTLGANCTTSASYSCYNPYTTTVTVAKATPVLAITYAPKPPVSGGTETLGATVSTVGTAPMPTGNVRFFDNATLLNAATLASGTAGTTGVIPTTATHSITATYDGDANYLSVTTPAGSSTSSMVGTTTTVVSSATTVTAGQAITLTATVTPASTGLAALTGTVQFLDGTTVLGSGTVSGQSASFSTAALSATTSHMITAVYSGDATYSASTSPAITVAGASLPAATLVASISPAISAPGGSAVVTAILNAPNATVPAGSIVATLSGVTAATVALPGTAATSTVTVTLPVTAPATVGTYPLVISCAGTNFTCSPVTLSLVVQQSGKVATTTTLVAASNSIAAGGMTKLTATITPTATSASTPSGSVIFYDGTVSVATATVAAGVASTSVTLTGVSAHSLTAVYSGDTAFTTSSSTAVTVTTAASAGAIVLTSNATSALAGVAIVLQASVTGSTSTGVAPTGTVSFYSAGTTPRLLGTAALGTAGAGLAIATLSTTTIPAGTPTVYAVYNGDTNFTSVTSGGIALTISDFNLTFVPQALTVARGGSGQSTLILGIIGGFSGTVTFGCTPPPNTLITCTFSPTVLTGGGSATLTVTTTPQTKGALSPILPGMSPRGVAGGVAVAALLLVGLPGVRRRRLPALLLGLLAVAMTAGAGCSGSSATQSVTLTGGTPLGTSVVTINTAGSDGVNTVKHDYAFSVTVQ